MSADVMSIGSGVGTQNTGAASGGKLEKAYLEVIGELGAGSEGGSAITRVSGPKKEFLFNPKEYSISKAAQAPRQSTPNAEGSGTPQFTGPDPQSMSVELFLDATEEGQGARVVEYVDFLMESCSATRPSKDARQPSLPIVIFGWGSTTSFPAFVKQVQVKYTLFKPDGTPIRATCSVTLEEVPDPQRRQNPTSGGDTAHRTHTVVAGETLASVAWDTYRDPTLWRALAERNGVDDPMRLAHGMRLMVPAVERARRMR